MSKRIKGCLLIILVLQVVLIVYFGTQKIGYNVDEMYTYTLSNYEDGFVTNTEGVIEEWKSGEFYKEVLEVSEEEAFSYNIPYQNQIGDVHPPLYYFVIHTISSIMVNNFSKWIGISVNILFNALTSLVLFWVSKKICKNDKLAIIITSVWALSNGVIESGIFARMYAMLTFFAIALVALHIKAYEEIKENNKISTYTTISLLGCTVCGILTQYYYMVFCFFLCGTFSMYLFLGKKWNNLIRYVVSEFGALMLSVVCFPYMLRHIFLGYRGKQAFGSVLEMQGYRDVLKSVANLISCDLFNGHGEEIVALLVISLMIILIVKKIIGKKISVSESQVMAILLTVVCIGYILVIAKIAPFQVNRYYVCIYPILTLVVVFCAHYMIELMCLRYSVLIVAVLGLVITGTSYFMQELDYLYTDCAIREEQLEPYQEMPAIILNGLYDYAPDNWIYEFRNYTAVYRCAEEGEFRGLENAISTYDVSDGFLIYAYGIDDATDELFNKLREHISIERFELITDIRCRVYYCTLSNS